jgi:hypothetical protein
LRPFRTLNPFRRTGFGIDAPNPAARLRFPRARRRAAKRLSEYSVEYKVLQRL